MIVEDGTGVTGADTYVDPAGGFATGYVESSLYADAWTDATGPRREAAVISASRTLDALYEWRGYRLTENQGLAWPRYGFTVDNKLVSGLPAAVMMATLELAMAMLTKNRLSDTAAGAAAVESIGLGSGAISIKFGADPTINTPTPPDQMIPPYVRRLLGNYGDTAGSNGMRRIERR